VFGIEGLGLYIQKVSESLNGIFTPRGTFIDGVTVGNRLGIGSAARVATLTALGLGQQRIDLFAQRIAFDTKAQRGKAEQSAESGAKCQQGGQSGQERIATYPVHRYTSPAKPIKASEARPAVIMPMAAP
jgi:hypothetical protein